MKIIKSFEQFTESLKSKEHYNPATAMDSEEFNDDEESESTVAESKKNDSEDQPIDNSSNKDNI